MSEILQVRIANFDGSNPIILERAKNRTVSTVISSSDEGVSFEIAKNDPKADVLNPTVSGYLMRWEVWETRTNKRLNYGPITDITEQGTDWKVTGGGRSALLVDFLKTIKTFYGTIDYIMDSVRYENLAAQPRTATHVPPPDSTLDESAVFGNTYEVNEKYYGISKYTKDMAIDDQSAIIKPGEIEPPNTHYTTDSYWAGSGRADSLLVDLGGIYPVSKINLLLPNWGGPARLYNRAYDFKIATAGEGSYEIEGVSDIGNFTDIYTSAIPNRKLGGATVTMSPSNIRFVRVQILDTHAWYGSHFDDDPSVDGWAFQCDPDYVEGSIAGLPAKGSMTEEISTRELKAENNCHASVTEIQVLKEIMDKDVIRPLALQRVDNNNRQIQYSHFPAANNTRDTTNNLRRYESGSTFRKASFTYSGAGTSWNKFYDSDCDNCYPDGFNFGVMDQDNNLVYATDSSSGTITRTFGAYTKHLLFKGSSNATVTFVDAWPAKTDPLSWGGSYSFTERAGDQAILHFRGQSVIWYATVPANKTGANVTVSLRSKSSSGVWSSWSTLSTFTLPNNITAEKVFEITYESGDLAPDTVYELRIVNNDGNWASIDSFEGYWSASMVEYNEDSSRITVGKPERVKQIYDKRYSGGSMYKVEDATWFGFAFTGDRIVVTSAKGRNHGKMRLVLLDRDNGTEYDPGTSNHVFIPGGNSDGSLTVDLDTGKRGSEITQFVMFDSNDYFSGGLPWGRYLLSIFMASADLEQHTTTAASNEFDSFVPRCQDCKADESESITVFKPTFLDGIFAHEVVGLSVAFDEEQHLEIIKSVAEAIQGEWKIGEPGIRLEPRIGTDTDIYLREGENTLVEWQIVSDISQMATILVSHGADIDGLPLYAITEDKKTRQRVGRTIMRTHDFRNVADYHTLVGLSRTELKKRAFPEKRVTVSHVADHLDLEDGDSFILNTKKQGNQRVRILRKEIQENSGRVYNLECEIWPRIV